MSGNPAPMPRSVVSRRSTSRHTIMSPIEIPIPLDQPQVRAIGNEGRDVDAVGLEQREHAVGPFRARTAR